MKKLFLFLFLFSTTHFISAQNEFYFSSDTVHTTSIQGVSLGAIAVLDLNSKYQKTYNYKLNLNYFNEISLAKRVTVGFDGGLIYNYNDYYRAISAYLGAEPRYYFSLNKRTSTYRGGLNSGWFFGLPVEVLTDIKAYTETVLYGSSGYGSGTKWEEYKITPFKNYQYTASLNAGYRYAITNHLFMEAGLGIGYIIYNSNFKLGHPYLKTGLKVAYTFNPK